MDLIRDPIPQLIRKLAVPASVGFFFNTMYNIVDTYFAGEISTHALATLSLSFPIFFIIIAMGAGISQGATALIANALGAGDLKLARHYTAQAVAFGALFAFVLMGAGWAGAPALFRLLGAEGEYLGMSLTYMNTILAGTVFLLLQSVLNGALNAQGNTHTFRNVLIVGFLANCVLDPWFLYGGLGIPALGIRGIALATVVIQLFSSLYMASRVWRTPLGVDVTRRDFRPRGGAFADIAIQGFPAGLNMATVAIGIFVITWFVSRFSTAGVAAYGIATRIEQMVLLPTIGLNIAVLSLVGQNNGAGRFDRVRSVWLTTLKYGLVLMVIGGGVIFFSGRQLMALFSEDPEVIRVGSDYLQIASLTLCSYVILFQTVYLLQGLKRPMYGLWIGLYRQIVAPFLVFYGLAYGLGWGLLGIWWGIFLVTWSAAIFTLFYGRWMLRKVEALGKAWPCSPDAAMIDTKETRPDSSSRNQEKQKPLPGK